MIIIQNLKINIKQWFHNFKHIKITINYNNSILKHSFKNIYKLKNPNYKNKIINLINYKPLNIKLEKINNSLFNYKNKYNHIKNKLKKYTKNINYKYKNINKLS
jgi:hypothetical protein